MNVYDLPTLGLADWRDTRDALHAYARVLGYYRRGLMPPQKHWWHITLSVSARGLTTTPMPAGSAAVELIMSPVAHCVDVVSSRGRSMSIPLQGQSAAELDAAIAGAFGRVGLTVPARRESLETRLHDYDPEAAARFGSALSAIDLVFKEFKGRLREESGPVQVFPHHFDLSLSWFTGRRVPGVDIADAANADEQMSFGFSTGDASISDAYFYATAYPTPEGLTDERLPAGACWHTHGFTGAVLPYASLAGASDARSQLLAFLRAAHCAGATLMRRGPGGEA